MASLNLFKLRFELTLIYSQRSGRATNSEHYIRIRILKINGAPFVNNKKKYSEQKKEIHAIIERKRNFYLTIPKDEPFSLTNRNNIYIGVGEQIFKINSNRPNQKITAISLPIFREKLSQAVKNKELLLFHNGQIYTIIPPKEKKDSRLNFLLKVIKSTQNAESKAGEAVRGESEFQNIINSLRHQGCQIKVDPLTWSATNFSHFFGDSFIKGISINKERLEGAKKEPLYRHLLQAIEEDQANFLPPEFKESINNSLKQLIQASEVLKTTSPEQFSVWIRKRIKELPVGESITIPGGWTAQPSGHAMLYNITRESAEEFSFNLFNAGAGLEYHPSETRNSESTGGMGVKDFAFPHLRATIPLSSLDNSTSWRQYAKMRTSGSDDLGNPLQAKHVYEGFLLGFSPTSISFPKIADSMITPQRAGTCTWKSLLAFSRSTLGKRETKLFKYFIRNREVIITEQKLHAELEQLQQTTFPENRAHIMKLKGELKLIEKGISKFSRSLEKGLDQRVIPLESAEESQERIDALRCKMEEIHAYIRATTTHSSIPETIQDQTDFHLSLPLIPKQPSPQTVPTVPPYFHSDSSITIRRLQSGSFSDTAQALFSVVRTIEKTIEASDFDSALRLSKEVLYALPPAIRTRDSFWNQASIEGTPYLLDKLAQLTSLASKAYCKVAQITPSSIEKQLDPEHAILMNKACIICHQLYHKLPEKLRGVPGDIPYHSDIFPFSDVRIMCHSARAAKELQRLEEYGPSDENLFFLSNHGYESAEARLLQQMPPHTELDFLLRYHLSQGVSFSEAKKKAANPTEPLPAPFEALRTLYRNAYLNFYQSRYPSEGYTLDNKMIQNLFFKTSIQSEKVASAGLFPMKGCVYESAKRQGIDSHFVPHDPSSIVSHLLTENDTVLSTLQSKTATTDGIFHIDLSESPSQHILRTLSYFSKNPDLLKERDNQRVCEKLIFGNSSLLSKMINEEPGFVIPLITKFIHQSLQHFHQKQEPLPALFLLRISRALDSYIPKEYEESIIPNWKSLIDDLKRIDELSDEESCYISLEELICYNNQTEFSNEECERLLTAAFLINDNPGFSSGLNHKEKQQMHTALKNLTNFLSLQENQGASFLSFLVDEEGAGGDERKSRDSPFSMEHFPLAVCEEKSIALNLLEGKLYIEGASGKSIPSALYDSTCYDLLYDRGKTFQEINSTASSCRVVDDKGAVTTFYEFREENAAIATAVKKSSIDLFLKKIAIQKKHDLNRIINLISKEIPSIISQTSLPSTVWKARREIFGELCWLCENPRDLLLNQDYAISEECSIWHSEVSGVLFCVNKESGEVDFVYDRALSALIPQKADDPRFGLTLSTKDKNSRLYTSVARFDRFYQSWKDSEGNVQKIELPNYNITFNRDATGLWQCEKVHGYHLSPNQYIEGLDNLEGYLVLENEKGKKRVLIPHEKIIASNNLSRPVTLKETKFSGQKEFFSYQINKRGRLHSSSIEGRVHLATIYLAQRSEHTIEKAQEILIRRVSPLKAYSLKELQALQELILTKEKSRDSSVETLTTRLRSAALIVKNGQQYPEAKDKSYPAVIEKIKNIVTEDLEAYYKVVSNIGITGLSEEEESLLLDCFKTALSSLSLQKLAAIKNGISESFFLGKVRSIPDFSDSKLLFPMVSKLSQYEQRELTEDLLDTLDPFSKLGKKFPSYFTAYYQAAKSANPTLREELYRRFKFSSIYEKSINQIFATLLLNVCRNPDSYPSRVEFATLEEFYTAVFQKFQEQSKETLADTLFVERKASLRPTAKTRKLEHQQINFTAPEYEGEAAAQPLLPFIENSKAQQEELLESLQNKQEEILTTLGSLMSGKSGCVQQKEISHLLGDTELYAQSIDSAAHQFNPEAAVAFKEQLESEAVAKSAQLQLQAEEILALANNPPVDRAIRAKEKMKRSGKKVKPITLDDALLLFACQNKNKYRQRNPYITDEQINNLHHMIGNYLLESSALQQKQRALQKLNALAKTSAEDPNYTALSDHLYSELTSLRAYDPSEHPEYLLFEHYSDIMIRPQQTESLNKLFNGLQIEDKIERDIVIQLIMGAGKSKVLLPLLALKRANGQNLSMVMLPEELFSGSSEDLQVQSGETFSQVANSIDWSDHSSKGLKNIYKKLEKIKKNREFFLTTNKDMHLFLLRQKEAILELSKIPQAFQYLDSEIVNRVGWYKKIETLFKESGDVVIDEVDLILHSRNEVHIASGDPESIKQSRHDLTAYLYEIMLTEPDVKERLNFEFSKIKTDGSKPYSQQHERILKGLLIQTLLNRLRHIDQKDPTIPEAVKNLLNVNRVSLRKYLLEEDEDATLELIAALPKELRDDLAHLKEEIYQVIPLTINKNSNEHYGLFKTESSLLAGPFGGANKPKIGSEFGSYREVINYTIQSYLKEGVSKEFLQSVIRDLKKEAKKELKENEGMLVTETKAYQQFARFFPEGQQIALFRTPKDDLAGILSTINDNPKKCIEFVRLFALPEVKIYTQRLSSNAQNLVELFGRVSGLTGTPWNKDSYHPRMYTDPAPGTDGKSIYHLCSKAKNRLITTTSSEGADLLDEIEPNPEHRALIDAGGRFKDLSTLKVAQKLLEKQTPFDVNGVIFFEGDEKMVLKKGKKTPIPYSPKEHSAEHYFSYYDQKHCTGVDLKQTPQAKAWITFNKNSSLRDFTQAVWRMRQLDKGQNITLILPRELQEIMMQRLARQEEEPNIYHVLSFLMSNQAEQIADDNFFALRQQLDNIIHSRAKQLLSAYSKEKISSIDSRVLDAIFTNFVSDSPFEQVGGFNKKDDRENVIENLRAQAIEKLELLEHLFLHEKGKEAFIAECHSTINKLIESALIEAKLPEKLPTQSDRTEQTEVQQQVRTRTKTQTQTESKQELEEEGTNLYQYAGKPLEVKKWIKQKARECATIREIFTTESDPSAISPQRMSIFSVQETLKQRFSESNFSKFFPSNVLMTTQFALSLSNSEPLDYSQKKAHSFLVIKTDTGGSSEGKSAEQYGGEDEYSIVLLSQSEVEEMNHLLKEKRKEAWSSEQDQVFLYTLGLGASQSNGKISPDRVHSFTEQATFQHNLLMLRMLNKEPLRERDIQHLHEMGYQECEEDYARYKKLSNKAPKGTPSARSYNIKNTIDINYRKNIMSFLMNLN